MPAAGFRRTVSATLDEFVRGVRSAYPEAACSATAGGLRCRIEVPPVVLTIDLEPLPPRRIALLALPQLVAAFAFSGGNAGERERVLAHLDRSMHRGGG
jgi:hypothetical protein